MDAWYCTREDIKAALDVAATAREDARIDRACESAARLVDGLTRRTFAPLTATRTFDWPPHTPSHAYRLWIDSADLVAVTSITSGGVTIPAADYFLRPDGGPPYNRVEIDLDSSSAWSSAGTHQRAISITGVWGYQADTAPGGALAEALDASETSVDVTDSAAVGVGSILLVDAERMIVTGKGMLDTGQNLGGAGLTASAADVTVTVTTGSAFTVGEPLLIDAERMLIVDVVAGNTLIVKRAHDGSVLAAHSAGVDIYAPRTLTVTRGALGTTAAAHDTATAITAHRVPGPIRQLTIAEALHTLLSETAGYARTAGAGDSAVELTGAGLTTLRQQVRRAYGRKARLGVV